MFISALIELLPGRIHSVHHRGGKLFSCRLGFPGKRDLSEGSSPALLFGGAAQEGGFLLKTVEEGIAGHDV